MRGERGSVEVNERGESGHLAKITEIRPELTPAPVLGLTPPSRVSLKEPWVEAHPGLTLVNWGQSPLYHKFQLHSATSLHNPTVDTLHAGSDSLGSTLIELEPLPDSIVHHRISNPAPIQLWVS